MKLNAATRVFQMFDLWNHIQIIKACMIIQRFLRKLVNISLEFPFVNLPLRVQALRRTNLGMIEYLNLTFQSSKPTRRIPIVHGLHHFYCARLYAPLYSRINVYRYHRAFYVRTTQNNEIRYPYLDIFEQELVCHPVSDA